MNKDSARKKAWIDCCYGRCDYSYGDDKIPLIFNPPTTICRWCKNEIEEKDAVVQSGYWFPSFYLGHKDCRVTGYAQDVYEQQLIDMDCNECKHFNATASTDSFGNRPGKCLKLNKTTYAYPAGQVCNAGLHDDCFEHRKSL